MLAGAPRWGDPDRPHWYTYCVGALYDLPLWLSLPTFVVIVVAASWAVLLAVRPWVRKVAESNEEWDRVLGYAMTSYGVFYGILLALIAVAVYENFQRVGAVVLDETASLGALYRGAAAFPQPEGDALTDLLRQYTLGVIREDWPLQQQDIIPSEGNDRVDRIESILLSFEPTTAGQQNLHNQTLSQFFDFVEARRARLDETKLALPPPLWIVLAIGAVLNALMLALVEVRNLRVHLIMSGIIAVFVGLLIFVTASMDHPYAGYVSITPEPFQNLVDQLMGGP